MPVPVAVAPTERRWDWNPPVASFLDPCAGEGIAIAKLAELLVPTEGARNEIIACEMESSRFQKLQSNTSYKNALHGDAFRVAFYKGDHQGVSVLFLNPPYDFDRVHGRLEQKFLARFTSTLADDGVLVFLVPFYALAASAETLAREYHDVRAYRFPEADFTAFKQVVLYAKKKAVAIESNKSLEAKINEWAKHPSLIPELPEAGPALYTIPTAPRYKEGLEKWQIYQVDTKALLPKIQPWMQSTRGGGLVATPNVIPELPVQDLLLRTYPLATPPRPAHIAAGIASGLFNGARLEPAPGSKLPSLLVKGVFDREYRTIDEKVNEDGETTGLVQVQQPKLVTTVLDLASHKYHTLESSTEESKGDLDVEHMTIADLLKHYGESMMGVMEKQCPILYDPRRDANYITLPESPRKLFTAQAHAVKALVKLLGGGTMKAAQGQTAVLLGEIGSGKSAVAVTTAETLGARRILTLCPPHLLQSWKNEIAASNPDAHVVTLSSVEDIDDLEDSPYRTVVALLSREAAKLGHSWEGVPTCPRCGSVQPWAADELAKKRYRCEHKTLHLSGAFWPATHHLALKLAPYIPGDNDIQTLVRGRFNMKRLGKYAKRLDDGKKLPAFRPPEVGELDRVIDRLVVELTRKLKPGEEQRYDRNRLMKALALSLFVAGSEEKILQVAINLLPEDDENGRSKYDSGDVCDVLLLLPPNDPRQLAVVKERLQKAKENGGYYEYSPWGRFQQRVSWTVQGMSESTLTGDLTVSWKGGKLMVGDQSRETMSATASLMKALATLVKYKWSPECGEFLFQAIPEPRRVALSRHIVRYHPKLFDFLVLDECHESASDSSAQGKSAHRLMGIGIPTLIMTGTVMNGYASSLYANFQAASPAFRLEFARDEKEKFITRYGYRKRILEDKCDGKVVEYGSQSDRVTRTERIIGNAPGLLPLFLLRHLLPISATLHKSDLAIDLPACKQERCKVDPGPELLKRYEILLDALKTAIKGDQFVKDRAGKLWGQLAELPSYLDRATADTGNTSGGAYEIRYPESLENELVIAQDPLPASTILPKEAWMLDRLEEELAEGRRAMVFSWHVSLLPRLQRLISERIGEPVPILHADKVPTAKRQDWIDREVVRKSRRVLLANPVAIQTGLNNLVHFATEFWMQSPACNPLTYRQGMGRVDRIGQKLETRILFPIYTDTLQIQLYDLLMQKVAVSVATDGLDPTSALESAGVGESEFVAGLSIGKALWRMMTMEVAA